MPRGNVQNLTIDTCSRQSCPWPNRFLYITNGYLCCNPRSARIARMTQLLKSFLVEDNGQDLIEYTLLMAFVALASAALFIGAGKSINTIWTTANGQLENAATSAS